MLFAEASLAKRKRLWDGILEALQLHVATK